MEFLSFGEPSMICYDYLVNGKKDGTFRMMTHSKDDPVLQEHIKEYDNVDIEVGDNYISILHDDGCAVLVKQA